MSAKFLASENAGLFFCLGLYALRLLLNFSSVVLTGENVLGKGDTLWWYGAFHYFVASVANGVLPLWNPYSHGGEPFYFLYSMYRFLDPAMLYSLLMAKLTKVDLLTIYQQYYLVREWLLVAGYLLLLREFTADKKARFLAGLLIVLSTYVSSQSSMHQIDTLSWTPWILFFAARAYRQNRPGLLLVAAWFTGILVGPSSYHFLYFIVFAFVAVLALAIADWQKFCLFVKKSKYVLGLCIVVTGVMSLPLLAIYIDRFSIFPVARIFGSREQFLNNLVTLGKFNPEYQNVFLESSHSFAVAVAEYSYFGRILGAVCLFFSLLGLFSLPRKFALAVTAIIVVMELFAMSNHTPVYYYVYKAVPVLQMIRHTVGYAFTLHLIKLTLIGNGISYLFRLIEESLNKRLYYVGAAMFLAVCAEAYSGYLSWRFIPIALIIPCCFLKSHQKIRVSFTLLFVIALLINLKDSLGLSGVVQLETRQSVAYSLNAIYPQHFSADATKFDPARSLALPRPGYLLLEPLIVQKNVALTTVLEPPPGVRAQDLGFLNGWKDGVVGNRTIYWPLHYPNIYLAGEKNIFSFYDMMGVDRQNLRFYPSSKSISLEDKTAVEAFIISSGPAQRLTDRFLVLNDSTSPMSASEVNRKLKDAFTNDFQAELPYELVKFDANSIRLKVQAPTEGYLLYNDGFDPYWQASVNRKSIEVYRANLAFKAVALPKGESLVEFNYRPSFFIGAVILYLAFTIMGIFLGACYVIRFGRKGRAI